MRFRAQGFSSPRVAGVVTVAVAVSSLVVVLVFTGCGSGRAPAGVRVSAKGLTVRISDGSGGLTEVGGDHAPLVFWSRDGTEHRAVHALGQVRQGGRTTYRYATDDPGRTMTLWVTHTMRAARVGYAVRGSDVAALGFSMTAPSDAHFLGTGQREGWVDLARTVQPLKVYNGCGSSSPSPFFASTAGFGAWVSTTAVGRIGFPGAVDDSNFACDLGTDPCSVGPAIDAVRWCFKTTSVEMTIQAGTLPEILTAHARAVGLPRAPWLPQLALMKWRDEISGPGELFDDIRQLRARNIPVGWVVLDNPWEQGSGVSGCYGSLAFDRRRYPDPKRMIARIHSLGVRFMLWISPQVKRSGCTTASYPDGWMTGDDETLVRDLTLPAARADFVTRLERLVSLGVDGFKGDRGDEVNLEPDRLAGGPGTFEQNAYPLLYDRAAAAALESAHGTRFATLFRSAVPGSSAVLPGFVGPDAEQSFNGLEDVIRAAQSAGVSGIPVWGSDVGGYSGGSLTSQIFVRWAQFAALTPIFEVGGAGANATFWRLGEKAVRGLRDAATLHYELVPYLYSLARAASTNGIPVVRPLGLTWPDEADAWSSYAEFTVGSDLLAAPVDKDQAASSVYLPPGRWVDLFSGSTVAGGGTTSRANGLYDFPLYLRTGSAIPFAFREPVVWSANWRPDDLLRKGRQGWLVALSDGGSIRSISDRGAMLTATGFGGETRVVIRNPLPEEQLRIYSPNAICAVRLDGHKLGRVAASRLPALRSAWSTWRRSSVVKVVGAGDVRLSLTACS